MSGHVYAVRYAVEPWGKPLEGTSRRVQSGVWVTEGPWGYTDVLFCASVLLDPKGEYGSILLVSSEQTGTGVPSAKLLKAVAAQCVHTLEEHLGEKVRPDLEEVWLVFEEMSGAYLDEVIEGDGGREAQKLVDGLRARLEKALGGE